MSSVSYDFSSSSALITGGTQGIGLAVAEAFARAGANVAICARTEKDVVEAVAALDELGSGAIYGTTADLADPDDVGRLFTEVLSNLGAPDILVNNAAAQGNFPFPEMDSERWRWMAVFFAIALGFIASLCAGARGSRRGRHQRGDQPGDSTRPGARGLRVNQSGSGGADPHAGAGTGASRHQG